MFAPCGMNCMVCYVHVGMRKHGKRCQGCLNSNDGKPEHCRKCRIKDCAADKDVGHCYQCEVFPCMLVKNLERSYNKRYGVSLVESSRFVKAHGVGAFMQKDREKWLCARCGGVFSLHDGVCSECGLPK